MKSIAKKVLLTVLSIFLIQQSYNLLTNNRVLQTESWMSIIFLAWIINMYITGIFAFAGFAFPTQKLLPAAYYTISQPSSLKKIYQFLSVDYFRKFLLATIWKSKKQQKKYFNGGKEGIPNLEEQSMKSEFGHLIPFILINIIGVGMIWIGLIKLGLCCILLNFLGNFYPIILQRHHRMRIQRIRIIAAKRAARI